MVEQLAHKIRKARKPYICDFCRERIEKGEEYERSTFVDGDIYDWKNHLSCGRIASAIWDYCDPDEGMNGYIFHEGSHDVCRDFVCPDCPHWNKKDEDCEKDEPYCIDRMDEFFKTHELYRAKRDGSWEFWKCRPKAEDDHERTE